LAVAHAIQTGRGCLSPLHVVIVSGDTTAPLTSGNADASISLVQALV